MGTAGALTSAREDLARANLLRSGTKIEVQNTSRNPGRETHEQFKARNTKPEAIPK